MKPCFVRNVLAPLAALATMMSVASIVYFAVSDALMARFPGAPGDMPAPEPVLGGLFAGLLVGAAAALATRRLLLGLAS
jgi:hypothetical protein